MASCGLAAASKMMVIANVLPPLLLLVRTSSAFRQSPPAAAKANCFARRPSALPDLALHMASTVQGVDIGDGREVRLRHQLQIGGLESDGGDLTGLKLWPTTAGPMLDRLRTITLPKMRRERAVDDGGNNNDGGGADGSNHTMPARCSLRPLRILELGSGCGLLGIGIASLGEEEVVLTDPSVAFANAAVSDGSDADGEDSIGDGGTTTLDWLRANIELNRDIVGDRPTTRKLFWGDEDDMDDVAEAGPYDLVVGSELLYYPESSPGLLATMRRFGKGGVPILLGYKTRRLGEARFLESAGEYFDIKIERIGRKGQDLQLAECLLRD